MGPPKVFTQSEFIEACLNLEHLGLLSPSSELEIMHRFFCWIPYSLRNSLTKFENFYQSVRLVWNRLSRLNEFQLKFIIGVGSNSEHPSLFWSYLPHLNLESHSVFLSDSLFLKEHSIKFSKFFSAGLTGWHRVQLIHRVSLYGALILVVLESKSYLVRAHKLHISPSHGLGPVMGHFMGCFQPTLGPFFDSWWLSK